MEALTVLVVVLGQHPPTEYISPESITPASSAAPPGNSQIRLGPIRNSQSMAARAPEVVPCTKVRDYSVPRCEIILLRAPRLYKEEPNRASVYRHTSKSKDTPRWRQKNDPNSEYILVVRRDQIFQSSGPGTYPRASRKAPPATFTVLQQNLPA